jgi:Family of unknown function (DUF6069)
MATSKSPAAGPIFRAGALAGAAAAAVNLIVFVIGKVAGVSFDVTIGGRTTGVIFAQPLFSSFFALIVGAAGLWVLARVGPGVTIWTALVAVIFVVETIYALAVAASTGTAIALSLMHVVVVAAAVVMLRPVALRG